MAAGDLNIALILRLVDQATGPARAVANSLRQIGAVTEQTGRSGVAWANEQLAANQARQAALMGEAFGVVAVAGTMAAALRPAIAFEQAMDQVGAVARASDDELALLTQTARDLGATTPYAASEAAQGMQFLAMAGFDVNQTVAAMPGLLALASAGATDLGATSDIASNILSGFGMEAAEMARLGDVLTNTFTSSNTDLRMLGETMAYVAPNARDLGVSLEDTAAMAGLLGNAGIQGSQAGTALRAMFLRLSSLPGEAADAMERLGVSTMDAEGNLRDMPTIFAEVNSALEGMGSATRSAYLETIFGMEASSAAAVLLSAAGSGALEAYAETLRESGSAARVAAQMNDNTAGALRRLQSISESLAISVGTILIPEIKALLEAIMPVIAAAQEWAEAHPELIGLIFKLTAGLLFFRLGSIALRWVLFSMLTPILQVIRAASWLLVLLPRLGRALLALLNPMKLVRGALIAIRLAFLATGIGALLAGVAMAGIWIYNNWEGLQTFFVGFWRIFHEALGPAAPMLDSIIDYARQIWEWFTNLLGPMDATEEQWLSWGQSAGEALGQLVGNVTRWIEENKGLIGTLSRLYVGFLVLRLGIGALRWGLLGVLRPFRMVLLAWSALSRLRALRWANLIPRLGWRLFVTPIKWAFLAGRLAWRALIWPLRWTARWIPRIPWLSLAKMLSWGRLIRPLAWTSRFIRAIPWLALTGGRFAISALVTALRWTARLIPGIGWAVLAGELLWHLLIRPLGWDRYLPAVDWQGIFGAFSWDGWIPEIDWVRIIGSISWPEPPRWLKWLMGEEEVVIPAFSETAGFAALPEDQQAAVQTVERVSGEGELPTAAYMAKLQQYASELQAEIAAVQAGIDNINDGPMKATIVEPMQRDLSALQEELEWVQDEMVAADQRAAELSAALMIINETDVRPDIDTASIDEALVKAQRLSALLQNSSGVAAASAANPDGARDRGGPVRAGMPYLVGERSPEIFVPGVSGTILPGRVLKAAMAASAMAAPVAAMPSQAEIVETLDRRPVMSAPAAAPQITREGDTVTINIYPTQGMSVEDIGREVERRLARREDARRADLHDGVDY